jgi:predicted nucleic acid-binding protein
MKTLVCNTGPLIALAKIKKIHLLNELEFKRVVIPPRVQKELLGKIGKESDLIDSALDTFIQVEKPDTTNANIKKTTLNLDEGEREVIFLGTSIDEVLLLLDDKAGRSKARQLNLPVVGTAGLLLLLKQRDLIEKVAPLMTALRQQGYWLSDALVSQVQQLAGE